MFYPILEDTYNNESISESKRLTRVKISHLLISIHGTAIKATEAPKMYLNAKIQDINNKGRNVVQGNPPMKVLADFSDMRGGVAWNSTTDLFCLLPIGSRDLSQNELIVELKTTAALAANDCIVKIFGVRLDDSLPPIEYQYRNIPADGINFPSLLWLYDVASAYNDTNESTLTFEDNSQITVPHYMGWALAQATEKLESENAYALIFQDKDISGRRTVHVRPTSAFDAFVVQAGIAV